VPAEANRSVLIAASRSAPEETEVVARVMQPRRPICASLPAARRRLPPSVSLADGTARWSAGLNIKQGFPITV